MAFLAKPKRRKISLKLVNKHQLDSKPCSLLFKETFKRRILFGFFWDSKKLALFWSFSLVVSAKFITELILWYLKWTKYHPPRKSFFSQTEGSSKEAKSYSEFHPYFCAGTKFFWLLLKPQNLGLFLIKINHQSLSPLQS